MTQEEALEIANGNKEAAGLLVSFDAFCGVLDDVFDKDKEVSDVRLVDRVEPFIEDLLLNPFVQANRVVLWPIIVSAFNSWLDANRWQRDGTPQQQQAADVLKGQYHEFFYFVARLCGGRDHMRLITTKHRRYDYDYKGATK